MSGSNVNKLLDIFTAYIHKHGGQPPFSSCAELYNLIDSVRVGDIRWESSGVTYSGDQPDSSIPWMDDVYNVWMRDPDSTISQIIGSTDYINLMDFVPYRKFDTETNMHRWQDFMSGDWAWEEAVRLHFLRTDMLWLLKFG